MSHYSLHNHTCSSNQRLIDSINKIEDLLSYAFELNLKGLALTEHETVNSHIKALNFIEKKRKEDERWQNFKLILGNEIYLCRNGLNNENYNSKVDNFYHFILLAKDEEGHKQLRQLSTRAYGRSFMKGKMRRVPTYYSDLEEIIKNNPGHLIGSTACIGGYIGKTLLKAKNDDDDIEAAANKLKSWILYLQSIFGPTNFFLELQPSNNNDQIFVNKWLIQFAHELNIPAIVTTDSHYLKKEDRKFHKAYLNSKDGDREVDEFYATTYLMSEDEIHTYMDKQLGKGIVDELLNNTSLIGDQIQQYDLRKPFKLPYLPSAEDIKLAKQPFPLNQDNLQLAPVWYKFMTSSEDSDKVFIHRILKKCYSNPNYFFTPQRVDRMAIELETIWNASQKQNIVWSKYFLQVADYLKIAWEDGDTIVGPGRGSGVGFYLNYLLDIIQIDPLRENVPTFYWRFLNPERASILDIDTDVQSNRRNTVIEALQKHYGELNVVRVGTERTEGSKAAILTAARGLEIDNDTAQYIASLIESDRGQQRSLHVTYYGNEEEEIPPNKTFQEEMKKYPELWEVAQKIEGLICGSGCHAGGVIIVDEDITNTNSLIKLNSGEWVTAWDLHEAEQVSNVKIDLLATDNLTRIRTCLDLLVRFGYIEKKSTLRETYEAAIGVYQLNRDNPQMWQQLADNKILSVFQFDTPQGLQGVALSRPESVENLAALNSIMRLMASEKGAEQPLEKFARFKQNPKLWDEEMTRYHLTADQKNLLHHYLDYEYGICASQEDIMSMIQDPQLGGWSVGNSDRLRKSIAKKDKKLYEKLTQEYFDTVKEKHLDTNLCNYFWHVLVATQRGYSFNLSHTLAYSLIGLQNMNLACNYPIIFWNTANLIVDSAGIDENPENIDQDEVAENIEDALKEEEEEEPEEEGKEKVKRVKKTIDYGKIARAIGRFKSYGINILPPNINTSDFTFIPNVEQNSITYGLRGITRVSTEVIHAIIDNRPYKSLKDFIAHVKLTKPQLINLIKSGAFDEIEQRPREDIMHDYLEMIADKKQTVNLRNMQMLIEKELIPDEMKFYAQLFLFNKYLKTCKSGIYYNLNESAFNFIATHFDANLTMNGTQINQDVWDKLYKKSMDPMRLYLKEHCDEILAALNKTLYEEVAEKYGAGNISKWEMESLSFYYHAHELAAASSHYDNFFELPEEPEIECVFPGKTSDKEITLFKLHYIIGAVIDKNKLKNTISLLTPDGVVQVKIYKNQYALFDKRISEVGADGKKKVIEESWFKKGTLLMVQGIRRDSNFIPKKYKRSPYPVISKIINMDENGALELQEARMEVGM